MYFLSAPRNPFEKVVHQLILHLPSHLFIYLMLHLLCAKLRSFFLKELRDL